MKGRLCLLILLVGGCATTSPAPIEYLLRPPLDETAAGETAAGAVQQAPRVTLGRVHVASYLDQAGIVVETGHHRIQVAHDHSWAEPLSQSLRRMLQVGIARAAEQPIADARSAAAGQGVVVDVDIHRLHGALDGKVVLDADWRIREADTGRVLGRYQLTRSTLTQRGGYDALVDAHVTLLEELSDAIARTLKPLADRDQTTSR